MASSSVALHHPIFSKFTAFKGEAAPGCDRDFIGSSIRQSYWAGAHRPTAIQVQTSIPPYDEEYFEWIDILESVVEARGTYTMMELGAGYGRWSARAALAARQWGSLELHLVAVEAEPVHFEWLQTHLRENGVDPGAHTLLQAAVSDMTGTGSLLVRSPEGNDAPDVWYGQTLLSYPDETQKIEKHTHGGYQLRRHKSGWRSIAVPQVGLKALLRPHSSVDLIDLDVQGEELKTISAAIDALDANTKRLHIGTHSAEIENGLRELLAGHGWECRADYGCGAARQTPYGSIHFGDGVQSWVNPRLRQV